MPVTDSIAEDQQNPAQLQDDCTGVGVCDKPTNTDPPAMPIVVPVRDTRDELIEETDETSIGTLPLGQSRRDLEFVIRRNAEQFHKLYPQIEVVQMNRGKSRPDPLYGETIFKKWRESVYMPAHFQLSPPEKLLRKYGLEVENVNIVTFSNRLLNRAKLKLRTGDRMKYLGITYEVVTMKLLDYFLNTQVPINSIAVIKQIAQR